VPDYVWLFPRAEEGMQHFADIDIFDINGGPTMLQRCHEDASNISAQAWKEYFDGFAAEGVGPEPGCLPFRVWQIWEAMVQYLEDEDVRRFVAAAGVLAHYVGDASQPLHCSYLHHGLPPMRVVHGREYPVPHSSDEFQEFKKTPPSKIHGIYEQQMFEVDAPALLGDVNVSLAAADPLEVTIDSGHGAATALIEMMHAAAVRLPPADIIAADDATLGPTARATRFWNNASIRSRTVASLTDSVLLLAALWQSAWDKGGGDNLPAASLQTFTEKQLSAVYRGEHETFVPSRSLDEMAASGEFEP
jgi:hypothetical protein